MKREAERLGRLLRKNGLGAAVAESCTAGAIGAAIASVDGASDYFLGGVISYAVSVKEDLLSVPSSTIEKYGVVSRETAVAMNRGVRKRLGAGFAISVTGYAGASGGDVFAPKGTVWLCVGENGCEEVCKCLKVSGSRFRNLRTTVKEALNLAVDYLSGRRS